MPYLIVGAAGLVAGLAGGFFASSGTKAVSNGIKYAALGGIAVVAAKKMKWI